MEDIKSKSQESLKSPIWQTISLIGSIAYIWILCLWMITSIIGALILGKVLNAKYSLLRSNLPTFLNKFIFILLLWGIFSLVYTLYFNHKEKKWYRWLGFIQFIPACYMIYEFHLPEITKNYGNTPFWTWGLSILTIIALILIATAGITQVLDLWKPQEMDKKTKKFIISSLGIFAVFSLIIVIGFWVYLGTPEQVQQWIMF
jgi:uncharacterized BrkB/YihY/UPF0761 family membrane protein